MKRVQISIDEPIHRKLKAIKKAILKEYGLSLSYSEIVKLLLLKTKKITGKDIVRIMKEEQNA